ncbi:VanZ family protein [Microbacterium sp. LRZ72]|uniref:VanZ family protein n=1 Tax=Microbacterium sp. LRZ72 TaxID=2942481 RepID=UPI0029A4540A|nr:VanZ family protein [Microbacterium sp. LRZ72]MDX2376577.1 VanZ family protein [Microbacterium sp. LRZ72]
MPTAADARVRRARVAVAVVFYSVALGGIALWPTHVDEPASGVITTLVDAVPLLTYGRLEFAANIALFVPFGYLFALSLPRWGPLVVPLGLAASLGIEGWQSLGEGRTASMLDVIANTAGAALGLAAALAVGAGRGWIARRSPRA